MSGVIALHRLLAQASPLPCSKGAAAFLSLVPAENNWFPLALDALLPALQDRNIQTPHRIFAAYLLDALFTSQRHLNPFHDHLRRAFESERAVAVAHSRFFDLSLDSPQAGGGALQAENEQLVWVLWKILIGEGEALSPYSPNILSRTTLPGHLRALRLVLQDSSPDAHSNACDSSIAEPSRSTHQLKTTATSQNPFDPQSSPVASMLSLTHAPTDAHVSSAASFSHFNSDTTLEHRTIEYQSASGATDGDNDGWLQELVHSDVYQGQYQVSPELSRIAYAHSSSHHEPPSSPVDLRFAATDDQRRQALLRALCEEPHLQAQGEIAELDYPPVGVAETEDRYGAGVGGRVQHRSGQVLQMQQQPLTPFGQSHAPPQLSTSRLDVQFDINCHDSAPTNSPLFISSGSSNVTRPPPVPIARPRPVPSLYYTSTPSTAPLATDFRFPSTLPPQQQIDEFSQQRANDFPHQPRALPANGSPPQTWKPDDGSKSLRTPGVIGSGRPFTSKGVSPGRVNGAGTIERRPPVGVIGHGRPAPAVVKDAGTVLTAQFGNKAERDGMMPCSMLRVDKSPEGRGRRDFGAIGPPKGEVRDGTETNVGGRATDLREALVLAVTDSTSPTSHGVAKGPVESDIMSDTAQGPKALSLGAHSFPISTPSPENGIRDNERDPGSSPQRHSTTSLSPPPIIKNSQLKRQSETSYLSPIYVPSHEVTSASNIDEKELDTLSHAILLLLSARERVLTLPEQRLLSPHLPMLTGPFSLLRPGDLPPLIAKNPDVAVKLFVVLLDRDDEESERIERLLKDVSKIDLYSQQHAPARGTVSPQGVASIHSLGALDVIQAMMKFLSGCGGLSISKSDPSEMMTLPFGGLDAKEGFLNVLRKLPPTMQSFNLLARLLCPIHVTPAAVGTHQQEDTREVRIANLVKAEVLGRFVSGCVQWIERAEQAERDGEVIDDRVAVAVSSLSRFYSSLLKHGFVCAVSEIDTTEIMSFALQFSRFEEARSLYSTLAAVRVD